MKAKTHSMVAMTLPRWIAFALLVLGILTAGFYFREISKSYERVSGKSNLVQTPYGSVEFAEGGSGHPVLVIHGSGGGFDQGELIAQAVLGEKFHWIAPSRFGYLQSVVPLDATFDEQAHVYAHLLDHLRIDKVAVVALSHGGPSALLFAVLHPERVSSLTLISCGVASSESPNQARANRQGDMLMTIFRYDPLYWGVSTLFRRQLMELMGASAEVIAGLTEQQHTLVDRVIDYMNPVVPRSTGAAFDNRAKLPNDRITAIRAPTLIIHATDDTLQLFANAQFAAKSIPGAQLSQFERGGHLLVAVEQPTIQSAIQQFILSNS